MSSLSQLPQKHSECVHRERRRFQAVKGMQSIKRLPIAAITSIIIYVNLKVSFVLFKLIRILWAGTAEAKIADQTAFEPVE
jgi:hypothetical protein